MVLMPNSVIMARRITCGNSTFTAGIIGSAKFPVAESSNKASNTASVTNPSAMKSSLVLPPR